MTNPLARLRYRYLLLEAMAREHPIATTLGTGLLFRLTSLDSLLSWIQAALLTATTFGSLIVGLVVGSGILTLVATWLFVHFGAFAIAMILGVPLLWGAGRLASSDHPRWQGLALGGSALMVMGVVRLGAAIWLWENVAGVPRPFALAWVIGTFTLSLTLRWHQDEARRAKRGRRAIVAVIVTGAAGDVLLEHHRDQPAYVDLGAPDLDAIETAVEELILGHRPGYSAERLLTMPAGMQSVPVTIRLQLLDVVQRDTTG